LAIDQSCSNRDHGSGDDWGFPALCRRFYLENAILEDLGAEDEIRFVANPIGFFSAIWLGRGAGQP